MKVPAPWAATIVTGLAFRVFICAEVTFTVTVCTMEEPPPATAAHAEPFDTHKTRVEPLPTVQSPADAPSVTRAVLFVQEAAAGSVPTVNGTMARGELSTVWAATVESESTPS